VEPVVVVEELGDRGQPLVMLALPSIVGSNT
jgi:hypothetical protein